MNPSDETDSRLDRLEFKVEQLMSLVDPDRDPFTFHMMEAGATREQVSQVLDVLDEYWIKVRAKTETRSHGAFESAIYEIFPNRRGDYHFAEGVVRSRARSGSHIELYKYTRRNGMNFQPLP